MSFKRFLSSRFFQSALLKPWLAAALLCLPFLATAQTLTITGGIQTYVALTNTAVTLSGHSALILSTTNNPLAGGTVNLTSPDAWLFLSNIRPAVVSTNYLSQISVNGTAAVSGSNVRVVEYVMGTVIIPQSPSVTPLQIFNAPNFAGNSTTLGLYIYYTNTALGTFYRNVNSFKLKHGYMATFAQNPDGTGLSKVFIAQDGDLEVGQLSASLNQPVSFVRVFPWSWVAKRGWADTADLTGDGAPMNPYWFYDWGNGGISTTNAEYVPMKWTASSGTSSINNKQNCTHVLGYNEPDSTSQANMTNPATAIADWPSLMKWGLRAGAPAVSDSGVTGQGLDWLYSFMNQASNLNYRVDFIPIHFYKCGWSAMQLSNYLAGVYQQTGKPIWLTEFNYGANWCDSSSSPPPTPAQEAMAISQFISVLENAPFVERYSIYNWVTTNREMVLDDGTVTPAGVLYRDTPTTIAYTQTVPPEGNRGIAQFHFETNTLDSSGYGNNALAVGIPGYTNGRSGQAVTFDGTNSYLQLPPTIANGTNFSFAGWVYWNGGASWQRIFDFGDDTAHYLFLTPDSGSGTLCFAINNGNGEQILETAGLTAGKWQHIAVTMNGGTVSLYTNGVLAATSGSFTISPASFAPEKNYFGRSQFPADPLFSGSLDEVQITDSAFTPAQIAALLTNPPPQFTTNYFNGGMTSALLTYSTNLLVGAATDPDSTNGPAYSLASGPAWLTVSNNGFVSGMPDSGSGGTNYFTIRATDAAGASTFAVLAVYVPIIYSSGTWSVDADGDWSQTNNWSNGLIAYGAGFTADFSTLNISANRTVTLDEPVSLGTLKFGDTGGGQNWTIATADNPLTLDTGSATTPVITVSQNTATIAAPLAGANGLAKTGAGTLVLSGSSSLSGTLYTDTGSTTTGEGSVCAANPGALLSITNIQIRDNNSGSSTLQLNGTNGNIFSPASIALNARNVNVAAIENISGSNTVAGGVSINVGGSYYVFQSDSGMLALGGNLTSVAAGNRIFTFQGNGDFNVYGVIQNGAATNGLTKTGSGTLTLAGVNTYTNLTTVNGGTLLVNGATSTGLVAASGSGTLGGNGTIRGAVTVQSGATIAPGSTSTFGTLTVANAVTLQAGSFTRMKVIPLLATNDVLKISGAQLNYGGTLVITNYAGTITVGSNFKLFSAATYTGTFSGINPATPGVGLLWSTNNLAVNGTLSAVLGNVNVQFGTVSLSGTNLMLNGSGGAAGANFSVLSSTSLATPRADWNIVGSGNFDVNGNFSFTNNLTLDATQQFFSVEIP